MIQKTCPSCYKIQTWDELWGFENRLCPEFCSFKFKDILPMNLMRIEDCWIDVDESIPDDFKEVLYCAVTTEGSREIMTGHREKGYWTHCCMFYSTMYLKEDVAVTHWMPLPDYPMEQ